MSYRYQIPETDEPVQVRTVKEADAYRVCINDIRYDVTVVAIDNHEIRLRINGKPVRAVVTKSGNQRWISVDGQIYNLARIDGKRSRKSGGTGAGGHTVEASMTGAIRQVLVSSGDTVSQGDPLIIMEAMKMELRLGAPRDGVIAVVHCQVDELVQQGDLLVTLADDEAEA